MVLNISSLSFALEVVHWGNIEYHASFVLKSLTVRELYRYCTEFPIISLLNDTPLGDALIHILFFCVIQVKLEVR